MDVCIIADDLTGANDAGVQCANSGYTPAVALTDTFSPAMLLEQVLIVNTDSRPLGAQQAYNRVRRTADMLASGKPEMVYKKLDSTLRGAVGAELDAVYDAFQPDFIVVNPSYPANHRMIIEGRLFVNEVPLQDTGYTTFAGQTVVTSSVVKLIEAHSSRQAAHLSDNILFGEELESVLDRMKQQGTAYLSFDSQTDTALHSGMERLQQAGFSLIFAGSAGAAAYLFPFSSKEQQNPVYQTLMKNPVQRSALFVVGSRSEISRRQRQTLMTDPAIVPISLSPALFFDQKSRKMETDRIIAQIIYQRPSCLLLYIESGRTAVKEVENYAADAGLSLQEASLYMAEQTGRIVRRIYESLPYEGLFLTGGDIAAAVSTSLGSDSLELYGEWEPGIPIGRLRGPYRPLVMTKAGGFGNEGSLEQALHFFQGGTKS